MVGRKHLALPALMLVFIIAVAPYLAEAHFNPPLITPSHTSLTVEGKVTALVPSADGSLIAVGTDSGLLYLVNTSSGEQLWATALQGGVTNIESDSDLSRIIVTSNANELAIYDRNGSLETMWERCTRYGVNSLFQTSQGYIVVTDKGGWLYAYNPTHVEGRGEAYPANYTYESPSGSLRINITRVIGSSLLLTSNGPGDEVAVLVEASVYDNTTGNATTYSIPGVMLYVAGDRSLTLKYTYLLDGLRGYAPSMIEYYMAGDQRAVLVAAGNYLYTYSLPVGGQSPVFLEPSWSYVFGGEVRRMLVEPGGNRILAYAADGNVYCFDKTTALRYTYRWSIALGSGGDTLAVSRDFSLMAAGSSAGWVYVFNVDLGERLWRAWFSESPVTALALSSTGYLAAAGYPGQVHMLLNADQHMNLLEVSVYNYEEQKEVTGTNVTLSSESAEMRGATPATFLLPSGTYHLHLDNLYIGVYDTEIELSSDTILVVPSDRLSQPIYRLIIKTADNETLDPVSGVKIEAYNTLTNKTYEATTDPYGTAVLSLPRGPYIVNATHPLYYPATVDLGWLTSNKTLSLKLTPKRAMLTISVESPVTGPLQNALVRISGPESKDILTGAGGVASAYLRLGVYNIRVEAPHHYTYITTVKLYNDTRLNIVMTPLNYTLRIRAFDAEYLTPIPLYHVLVSGTMNIHLDLYLTPSNNTLSLPYGTYSVRVEARGFQPQSYTVYLDSNTDVRLDLQPIRVLLELRVSSSLTGPLQGANITLTGPENISSYTDIQGYARIYVRIGVYNLTVRAPHHVAYKTTLPIIADTYLSIQLKPQNYTLTLVVRDAETGGLLHTAPITVEGPLSKPIVKITGVITPSNNTLSLPYGTYRIAITPRFYKPYTATVTMAANTTLDIYAAPIRLNIAVYVVSETMGPVSNARVMLMGPEQLSNNTGVNGVAYFKPRMGNYTIRVEAAFHDTYIGQVFIGESKVIRVVLKPLKYTLRIIARDSETLEAIPKVTVTMQGPSGITRFNITPGTLLTLPYGNYKFTLQAPGYREASITLEPLYYSQTITVDMTPIKQTLSIVVVDPIHGPVSSANISISGVEELSLATDRFGRASAPLRLGSYTIRVSAPHHKEYTTHITMTGPKSLQVVLAPLNYTLGLKAVDIYTGELLSSWRALIEGPGVKLNATMTRRNYTVTLPYGNYTVRIYAEHYIYERRDVSLNTNEIIVIQLHPVEYMVTVNVSAKPIGPLQDALIQAYREGKLVASARTDKHGDASLRLPYGNYTLIASKTYFEENRTVIELSAPLQVNLTLKPITFTVTVRVIDSETGKPIPRGLLELYSPTYNATYKANVTGGVGSIKVLPGTYTLIVKAADHVTFKGEVKVSKTTSTTVKMKPIYYAVMIRVVDDRGSPIKHAWVEIRSVKPITGYTDSSGTFVTNLKKGAYPIYVKAHGYHSKEDSVLVAGPVSKTIKLMPTPLTLFHRYLSLIVALIVVPAFLLGGAVWYRRRRERLLEEEMEELEEI